MPTFVQPIGAPTARPLVSLPVGARLPPATVSCRIVTPRLISVFTKRRQLTGVAVRDWADRMEPRLAKAAKRWLVAAQKSFVLRRVEEALDTQSLSQVMGVLNLEETMEAAAQGRGLPPGEESFADVWARIFWGAGLEELKTIAHWRVQKDVGLEMVFDQTNPEAIAFLTTYRMGLIREISEGTRQAVQDVVLDGFKLQQSSIQIGRNIRDHIGLTSRQSAAVRRFGDNLRSGDPRRMKEVLIRDLRDHRYDGSIKRALAAGKPMPADKARLLTDRYRERMIKYRADMIARTESLRASVKGQQELWRQANQQGLLPDTTRMHWLAGLGPRTCPQCLDIPGMNPEGVPLNGTFDTPYGSLGGPPAHPQCLPGDTCVAAQGIAATSIRQFQGDLIIIRTASDKRLACTVNHPVLTPQGFVPAHSLDVGCDVIRCDTSDRLPFGNINDKNMPPTVEEITDLFGITPGVTTVPVPTSAEDFHGDGKGSEVTVINTDGLLRDDFQRREQINQLLLMVAHEWRRVSLMRGGAAAKGFIRTFGTADGIMRGCGPLYTLLQRTVLHAVVHGSASVARDDSGIQQAASDGTTVNTELVRQCLLGLTGRVALDKIVDIQVQAYHGKVYNMETASGVYVANSIVTHNCRCGLVLRRGKAVGPRPKPPSKLPKLPPKPAAFKPVLDTSRGEKKVDFHVGPEHDTYATTFYQIKDAGESLSKNVKSTAAQEMALSGYSSPKYANINRVMRKQPGYEKLVNTELETTVDQIKALMKTAVVEEDVVAFRGAHASLAKAEVGGIIEDAAFASTSLDIRVAANYAWGSAPQFETALIARIKVPKGSKGVYLGSRAMLPTETELLLANNTKFRVVGLKKIKRYNQFAMRDEALRVMDLEVVP